MTPQQAKLRERLTELRHFRDIHTQAQELAGSLEALSHNVHTLVEGGEAASSVVSNWRRVWQAIQMASSEFNIAIAIAARLAKVHLRFL